MAKAITVIRNHRSIVVNTTGHPSIEVNIDALAADIVRQATLHGIAQKLGDAAAKERDTTTGQSAPLAVKYAAMRRVADALIAGDWTLRPVRVAADAITPERVEAVARARNADPATVERWLTGLSVETRAAAFSHPTVAVALAAIRAERAAAQADPDADPFAGLGDGTDDDTAPL